MAVLRNPGPAWPSEPRAADAAHASRNARCTIRQREDGSAPRAKARREAGNARHLTRKSHATAPSSAKARPGSAFRSAGSAGRGGLTTGVPLERVGQGATAVGSPRTRVVVSATIPAAHTRRFTAGLTENAALRSRVLGTAGVPEGGLLELTGSDEI